ncbi:MAG: helix-turn-helix transcriptional regulator [Treponema sp.]|nr:helix-turn-helix transcriptional regulator [Treponema sp.]
MPSKDGDINKRIGEIRKALGMRQDEFAEAIKVSRSYSGRLQQATGRSMTGLSSWSA